MRHGNDGALAEMRWNDLGKRVMPKASHTQEESSNQLAGDLGKHVRQSGG